MKTLFLLSLLGFSSVMGCNAIDRATDCRSICTKYRDCVGPSTYDTSACSTRCRDYAANSEDNNRRVDVCQACTDNRPCSGAVFGCLSECAGIPFSP